jgi:Ig-like domain CHU_C associated
MGKIYSLFYVCLLLMVPELRAQCSTTNATTCACQTIGATNCELLPDLMISWQALQSYASGPSEYSQTNSGNAGRLRVSGATPNVGHGPLEVRGVNAAGYRKFICGSLIDSVYAPTSNPGFTCSNGFNPKQILFQRVYRKNGNVMSYTDTERGTMTYHSGHGHYHIDGWTTMTLRIKQPGVSDARQWPIVATGGKLGFCLINLFTCSGSPGYCRTSHLFNQGTTLTNASFGANYNLGQTPYSTCGDDSQGIYVGAGDIYSESLDGMWLNLMPGLCNNVANDSTYWIVADVDPLDDWVEENNENNWAAIPFNLTQQSPNNSGGTASIITNGPLSIAPGETRTLTATPGRSYAWSNGATTRSITINAPGTFSCTVNCPCGSLSTPSLTFTALVPPPAPLGTDAYILNPSSATLGATGTDLHWFNASTGGSEVGTGSTFNTPVLTGSTSYWVEDRSVLAGADLHAGKPDNTSTGGYSSNKEWLFFDAYQPFRLESVKVYAQTVGVRHFVLVDRLGNLISERFIEIPSGTSVISLNWDVPAGTQHRISAFDDASDVTRALWRNTAGVSFPYSIGALGAITGSSAAGVYPYLYDWVVKTNSVVATSARTMVTAHVTDGVLLDAKVLLDGPFDSQTGLMNDGLRVAGLIPSMEPFTAAGFVHAGGGGGETVAPALLQTSGTSAPVDWVLLELRSAVTPSMIVATRSAIVLRNGQIVDGSGGPVRLPALDGSYHVAVRHRNHLGAMTSASISLGQASTSVDFTLAASTTWGTNARKTVGVVMTLWSGNALRDAAVKYIGQDNDRDPILALIGGTIPTNTSAGYHPEDSNLDGLVKYVGQDNDRDPILANIGGSIPTNTLPEQLP